MTTTIGREKQASTIIWTHIPFVPQVAVVGHLDGLPVAVIDQVGATGFRATLCRGKDLGIFPTLEKSKRAVAASVADQSSDSLAN